MPSIIHACSVKLKIKFVKWYGANFAQVQRLCISKKVIDK